MAIASNAGVSLLIDSDGNVFKSTDGGVTWASLSSLPGAPFGGSGGNLIYSNGVWIYSDGATAFRSADGGATWSAVSMGTVSAGFGMLATDGVSTLVMFANVLGTGTAYAHSTDNGLTWTGSDPIAGGTVLFGTPPLWDGAKFVALATDAALAQNEIITSTDGITWAITNTTNVLEEGLSFGNGVYLAGVGASGADAVISANTAINLAAATPVDIMSGSSGINAVLAASGLYFAFSTSGIVSASDDAANWIEENLGFVAAESIFISPAVAFDSVHSLFIAGGSNGSVSTRDTSRAAQTSIIHKLTQKLLLNLHRVFDKNPYPQLALRLQYDGSAMTWQIANGVLTTTVTGGSGANQSIALSNLTIATLAALLASLPGYSVPFQDATSYADLSALVLIDGTNNLDTSNGDHLYGYTTLLWAYLETSGSELGAAKAQIPNMLAQMTVPTAEAEWLDEHGGYYLVPRATNETDPVYAPRIISQVIQPRGNNVAMSAAIQSVAPLATRVRVIDAINDLLFAITYNGLIHFDGTAFYDAGLGPGSGYGFFDVDFSYDFLGPVTQADYITQIRSTVEAFRDGGTQLRGIIFRNQGSTTLIVSDTFVDGIRIIVFDDFSTLSYRLLENGLVRLLETGDARLLE